MKRFTLILALGFILGTEAGWHCYDVLDDKVISGPSYPDWQRHELTKEIYYLAKNP